eukprot:12533272-Alexandrium_andersonii.AAC.1
MKASHGATSALGCGSPVRYEDVRRRSSRSAISCACQDGQHWRQASREGGACLMSLGRNPRRLATTRPGRGVAAVASRMAASGWSRVGWTTAD